jgi:predicted  nucleic acid-binding Zn-ribbon protein
MRYEPTLIVMRLVIERNGRAVYDEAFHEGVNVIRGENSSGKSTVLNCIYYGIGGDLSDWSEAALLCTRVIVEVRLNAKVATLSRDIARRPGQPMEVFGGDYDTARSAPRAEWLRYPYRRSQNRESFSQALFRLLGIPEVTSDISGNVTIHQILRLLYADQLSPVEDLFRFERFDQPALRDAVGRLLCGAYESRIYDNELQIRSLSREFDAASAELHSLFAVLGKAEQNLTLEWIEGQRRVLEEEQQALQQQVEDTERQMYASGAVDQLTLKAQDEAYAQVQRLQAELVAARQHRDALALEIADSAAFITSLENKIAALNDSSAVAQYLGDVRFSVCPACYAPIEEEAETSAHACHLCKTPFDSEQTRGRIVSMINDAAIQLKQSRILQSKREEWIQDLDAKVKTLDGEWQRASRRLASLQRLPSSETSERLRDLNQKTGYLERKMEDLGQKVRLVQIIDRLANRKAELNEQISRLETDNGNLRASQQNRLSKAYTMIADEVRTLLRNDLRRQDSFEDPESIEFSFEGNKISVDGHTYFSASARVILKSSFFLGFFAAATKDPPFRHPRFVMLDTIEDKGMEPARSHNFQNQILRVSEEAAVEHQIIYATSMIAPDLDHERHTIGRFSTGDSFTLDI